MDLRLGDVLTNQKGGKFLPAESLRWNTTQWAGKKLEAQLQSCMKQTRANRQSLKLKATLSKVRFWDADGNRLMGPPAELRGRKALLTIEVRQLWIMGQQCGLLMEARDIKLQGASSPECPL